MHWMRTIFLALAYLGGAGFIAGTLWSLLAHGLWGHPAGPPPHLSPEEARAWTHEHPGGIGSPHAMRWEDIRVALREQRWAEVWPVALALLGGGLALVCVPASFLVTAKHWWKGALGLGIAVIILVRVYTALWGREH